MSARRRPSRLGVVAVLLLLALLAGCTSGEGDSEDAPPEETPTPTPEVRATSPQDLDAYRYAVSVRLLPTVLDISEAPSGLPLDQPISIRMEGERVNPDREYANTSIDLGFMQMTMETIEVGAQRWMRQPDGTWQEGSIPGLQSFAGLDFRPSAIFADDSGQYAEVARRLQAEEWTTETFRGMDVQRFVLTREQFAEVFAGQEDVMPAEVDADLSAEVWLERDRGTPVRLIVTGTDAAGDEVLRLDLEVWDLDAEDIAVEPPG